MSDLFIFKPFQKKIALPFLMNAAFLVYQIILIYKSNPQYAREVLTQDANVIFYIIFILFSTTCFYYGKERLYSWGSLIFVVNIIPSIKLYLQKLIFNSHFFENLIPVYVCVVISIVILLFILIKFLGRTHIHRYIIRLLFFFYLVAACIAVLKKPTKIFSLHYDIQSQAQQPIKNLYILLFDEYPSFQVSENFLGVKNGEIKDFLAQKKFHYVKTFSNFTNTEKSIPSILTTTLNNEIEVSGTIHSLYYNKLSAYKNFQYHVYSVFDNTHRPNSLISSQFFNNIDNVSVKYILPFCLSLVNKRGDGVFFNFEYYHKRALDSLKVWSRESRQHLVFMHFYSPHKYPKVEKFSFAQRINDSNTWMKEAINRILEHDFEASIIIVSDHGVRNSDVPMKDWDKNVLLYRNYNIDTAAIRGKGIYQLLKNL